MLLFALPFWCVIAESRSDLVDFLLLKNSQARESYRSTSYTLEYERHYSGPQGPNLVRGSVEMKRDGDSRMERGSWTRWANGSSDAEFRDDTAVARNDTYTALRTGELPLYAYMHSKELGPNPEELNRPEIENQLDVFPFLFGPGPQSSLQEQAAQWPGAIEAETVRGDIGGQDRFVVRLYAGDRADGKLHAEHTLDPETGYLITKSVYYDNAGSLWLEREFDGTSVTATDGSASWAPTGFRETRYEPKDISGSQRTPTYTRVVRVKDFEVNGPIDPIHFTVDGITDHPESPIVKYEMDGTTSTVGYYQGKFMPFREAMALRNAVYAVERGSSEKFLEGIELLPDERSIVAVRPVGDIAAKADDSATKAVPARRQSGLLGVLAVLGACIAAIGTLWFGARRRRV